MLARKPVLVNGDLKGEGFTVPFNDTEHSFAVIGKLVGSQGGPTAEHIAVAAGGLYLRYQKRVWITTKPPTGFAVAAVYPLNYS
jgi:hypothetical protein